jgi:hypothetical protein
MGQVKTLLRRPRIPTQLRSSWLIRKSFALVFDSSRRASVSCILSLSSLDLLLVIARRATASPRNARHTTILARIRLNLSSIDSQESYRFVGDTVYRC